MKPVWLSRLIGRITRPVRRAARPGRQDTAAPGPALVPPPGRVLRGFRLAALSAVAVVITAASGASFAESYRGLWLWARHHGLSGFWAAAFPLQVDAFIVVGELSLFIAMTDRWRLRDRAGAWAVALLGLAASVAGNIGHAAAGDIQTRGTAAVPPLAAFAALWVDLGVLKRTLARHDHTAPDERQAADGDPAGTGTLPQPDAVPSQVPASAEHAALIAFRATLTAGNPLSGRQLETRFGITRAQAAKVRSLALGDGERHEEAAARALLGLPAGQVPRLRRIGERDEQALGDDAGKLIPA